MEQRVGHVSNDFQSKILSQKDASDGLESKLYLTSLAQNPKILRMSGHSKESSNSDRARKMKRQQSLREKMTCSDSTVTTTVSTIISSNSDETSLYSSYWGSAYDADYRSESESEAETTITEGSGSQAALSRILRKRETKNEKRAMRKARRITGLSETLDQATIVAAAQQRDSSRKVKSASSHGSRDRKLSNLLEDQHQRRPTVRRSYSSEAENTSVSSRSLSREVMKDSLTPEYSEKSESSLRKRIGSLNSLLQLDGAKSQGSLKENKPMNHIQAQSRDFDDDMSSSFKSLVIGQSLHHSRGSLEAAHQVNESDSESGYESSSSISSAVREIYKKVNGKWSKMARPRHERYSKIKNNEEESDVRPSKGPDPESFFCVSEIQEDVRTQPIHRKKRDEKSRTERSQKDLSRSSKIKKKTTKSDESKIERSHQYHLDDMQRAKSDHGNDRKLKHQYHQDDMQRATSDHGNDRKLKHQYHQDDMQRATSDHGNDRKLKHQYHQDDMQRGTSAHGNDRKLKHQYHQHDMQRGTSDHGNDRKLKQEPRKHGAKRTNNAFHFESSNNSSISSIGSLDPHTTDLDHDKWLAYISGNIVTK